MTTVQTVRHLSITIQRDAQEVYEFLAIPENFPRWASGLGAELKREGETWIATTAEGSVRVRFSPPNSFGIVDHWVEIQPGTEIYIPLRAIANGAGCEVIFTLFRLPEMSDEKFEADAQWVLRDLATLKDLLEG